MKWFIVFEWWKGGGEPRTENEVWEGNHPIQRLMQMRAQNREGSYRLLWWTEIDANTYWNYKEAF